MDEKFDELLEALQYISVHLAHIAYLLDPNYYENEVLPDWYYLAWCLKRNIKNER